MAALRSGDALAPSGAHLAGAVGLEQLLGDSASALWQTSQSLHVVLSAFVLFGLFIAWYAWQELAASRHDGDASARRPRWRADDAERRSRTVDAVTCLTLTIPLTAAAKWSWVSAEEPTDGVRERLARLLRGSDRVCYPLVAPDRVVYAIELAAGAEDARAVMRRLEAAFDAVTDRPETIEWVFCGLTATRH
ncbi:MAG: hypothetical protein HYV63_22350 [Candidatus Schekmanbacteria bacterium]|nr:hypothetical protein [Candidatus Schekmanbacteria bacterium]